jgi:phage protein D/phage baseplate assembly protein gpV
MPQDQALIRQLYIRLDGTLLEQRMMDELYRVEVESDLRLPAMCLLRLHDPEAKLTNEGPFSLGAELRVAVADEQGRGEQLLFCGEITGLEPEFGEGMLAELTVRAYDRSHRLQRGTHTKAYLKMSDSDIAQEIARAVGLRAEVDPSSPVHEHVYQDGQTHLDFLRSRAQRLGYEVYVRERTLYFKRAGQALPERVALEWGQQLRAFRPILTLSEQVGEVEVRGWDPAVKREVVGRASRTEAAPRLEGGEKGAEVAQNAFGPAKKLAVRSAVSSQAEADALAQALLDRHGGAFVEAEGLCYGTPQLQAGCIAEISALGRRFNGRYLVTTATHIWNTGADYLTRFTVRGRRGETWRELLLPEEPPPRWLAMTGIVTNNNDPSDLGRVKVKFPWLDGEIESAWARVVGLGAGDGRGLYALPEVNDEVLVIFEQGDIGRPLVIGGLWNGSDAPPAAIKKVVTNGKVQQRLWVTRAGHRLEFTDENSATIRLESAGGHAVLLDDDAGKIEITTAGGMTVVLDDQGKTLRVKGTGQIQIEAGQNMTLKAQGNMDLEANGVVTIKGSLVQLNP